MAHLSMFAWLSAAGLLVTGCSVKGGDKAEKLATKTNSPWMRSLEHDPITDENTLESSTRALDPSSYLTIRCSNSGLQVILSGSDVSAVDASKPLIGRLDKREPEQYDITAYPTVTIRPPRLGGRTEQDDILQITSPGSWRLLDSLGQSAEKLVLRVTSKNGNFLDYRFNVAKWLAERKYVQKYPKCLSSIAGI